jgi:hypothetical protein
MTPLPWILATILLNPIAPAPEGEVAESGGPRVEDIFGRSLLRHGLTLVDWEGYLANPAIRIDVVPPPEAAFPARAVLRAGEPRLYFDLPSTAGPDGPRKVVTFRDHEKVPVFVSIFPDRDTRDEEHALEIEFTDARGMASTQRLPVRVVDQDRDRPAEFAITVDFSQDKTGFFEDEGNRAVVERAAGDWAYFLDGRGFAAVPAGAEKTLIWGPDGFRSTHSVTNAEPYTGFRLYAYGIQSDEVRSGGEPSRAGGFQVRDGERLAVRRSGGVEVEVRGNYNTLGWAVGLEDDEWWKGTNLRGVKNDLYSIVHHEMGHALFFNPGHVRFGAAKVAGALRDEGVRAYLGSDPKIDAADHFRGTRDPASRRGAFGHEYHGAMPLGRWMITRFDLMCARAIGYPLRETSAFSPLKLLTEELPPGVVSKPYGAALRASGGIPFYHWEVVAGGLPEGLSLDPFTGEVRGTPGAAGEFDVTLRVRDYEEKAAGLERAFTIRVGRE